MRYIINTITKQTKKELLDLYQDQVFIDELIENKGKTVTIYIFVNGSIDNGNMTGFKIFITDENKTRSKTWLASLPYTMFNRIFTRDDLGIPDHMFKI